MPKSLCTRHILAWGCLVGLAIAGCGTAWRYNYADAEQVARDRDEPLLVFYRDHLDARSGEVEEMLDSSRVRPLLKRYVRASLVKAYGPNRKAMAQCGVTHAPALVIIHPDGTFHALREIESVEDIARFLGASAPPGEPMAFDVEIPRPTDFILHAENIYERAVDKAARQNRKLLVIYKWWLDGRSTRMLSRLTEPAIANRAAEAISCILDWDYRPNRDHVARFGVHSYPALIVVNRDGTFATLVGLRPVEEIVQFLAAHLQSEPAAR